MHGTNTIIIKQTILLLHTVHQNSDMLQSISFIFREILNIYKAHIKTWIPYQIH